LFERKGIAMRNSRIRHNPKNTGRRKKNWYSRRRGLNPKDLRTMGKSLG
jgi:hypothetical protein